MDEVLLELHDSVGVPVFVRCLPGRRMAYGFWDACFIVGAAEPWNVQRTFRKSRLTAHLAPIIEATFAAMESADAHDRT